MPRQSAFYTSAFNTRSLLEQSEFDSLTGLRIVQRAAFVCFADGDGDEDGDGKPPRTYTNEEVEKMIKTRIKKAESEAAKLAAENERLSKGMSDLSEKFEKLNEKYESSNKSDVEKELAKAQRALQKYEADLANANKAKTEAEEKAAAAAKGLTTTRLQATIRDALRSSQAHATGMEQAVQLMMGAGATLDEEGAFSMSIDNVPYDKPVEAAKKWLETNPHFVEGSGGGSGTVRSGAAKLLNNQAMESMSPVSLIAAGLKSTP